MLPFLLAQAQKSKDVLIAPQEKALIHFLLIVAVLGIGLLVVIGLIVAWRNHIARQREIEQDYEDRDNDMPRPDAWATAAQRIAPEDAGPDEAHVSPYLAEDDDGADPGGPDPGFNEGEDEEEDDDDFPFGRDEDEDGPIGRG